ncbi:MAG: lysylphosphatidylglycerol synthase transmembrane domain-containing protein [Polyangiaceae bacterium]
MKSRTVRVLFAVAVSAVFLALVLRGVDPGALRSTFVGLDRTKLVVAWGAAFVVVTLRSVRFAVLARTPHVPTWAATTVQNFANRVLPLRLGEIAYPWMMERSTGLGFADAVIDVVFVRLVDLCVAVTVVLGLAWNAGPRAHLADTRVLALLAVVCVGTLVAFRPLLVRVLEIVQRFARARAYPRLLAFTGKIADAAARAGRLRPRDHAVILVASTVQFVAQAVVFGAVLAACHVEVGPADVALATSLTFVGGAVLSGGVGTLGSLEVGWVLGFVAVGVSREAATSSAFVCQWVTMSFAAFHGLVGWVLFRRRAHLLPVQ